MRRLQQQSHGHPETILGKPQHEVRDLTHVIIVEGSPNYVNAGSVRIGHVVLVASGAQNAHMEDISIPSAELATIPALFYKRVVQYGAVLRAQP